MKIKQVIQNGCKVAVVCGDNKEKLITDVQSALDLIMSAKYEADTDRIALDKEIVADEFFVLSSGLAGEILQKFINYNVKVAIFGDYSYYTSKPLHDFIYESNNGKDIFFLTDEAEAVSRLASL